YVADLLAGPHAPSLVELGRALQVHVHVVVGRLLAVDDEVVPGPARLVPPVLDPAAPGGLQRGPARREDILSLVRMPDARGSDSVAVAVAAAHRELEAVIGELGLGRGVHRSTLRSDAELVAAVVSGLSRAGQSVPGRLVDGV